MATYQNYIGGQWVAPAAGEYYEIRDPGNRDELVGCFPLSGTGDVDRAVEAAHKAFKSWSRLLPMERVR